jgi:tRNA 5-methylaminomethyl-2-thiouridine biosynthesis bifunctional protein
LHAVRGQVSWQLRAEGLPLPDSPVNGNGHFLPSVPLPGGVAWLTGSTYGRGETTPEPRAVDHAANLDRLRALLRGEEQQHGHEDETPARPDQRAERPHHEAQQDQEDRRHI